ncbi:MAG: phosphoglycerate kinase [Clostridia bacterium]|nr:phosphoglycerate kinase [Clostridia bacterium]
MNKKTVKDIDVKGKKVLMRCDFNVPMDGERITDENRINGALPTIQYLIDQGAALILCSHMGKPHNVFNSTLKLNKKEKVKIDALPEEERAAATEKALEKAKGDVKKFSLAPVAKRLSELLGQEVVMAEDVIGPDAQAKAAALKPGQVMVLQNLRFHAEEEKNDPEFAKALASLAEIYVNDAFGTAHRAHASTEGVTHYLPAACGFLIEKELRIMGKALENADRPFVAVLGGAKIEDKLNVINNLLEKVDTLIIGGGMAFTFLKAKGYEVGQSLLDESKIDYCKDMMKKAEEKGVKLLLPIDSVCVKEFPNPIDAPIDTLIVDSDKIPADMQGCDIGPKTIELFGAAVKAAKTVVWNGPMGVFENPTLAKGTLGVAQAMADSDAVTIIGGGDSAAAVQQMGLASKMTHISTGGGASLEYLEGKVLPGVAALNDK